MNLVCQVHFSRPQVLLPSLCCVLLTACGSLVPDSAPPHLDYTPGPAVTVTEETYDAGVFSVRYPRGWRVITAAAFSIPWVVFTNPDETALIVLALAEPDTLVAPANTPEEELNRLERVIRLENGEILTAALVAPYREWDEFVALFERVVASLAASSET